MCHMKILLFFVATYAASVENSPIPIVDSLVSKQLRFIFFYQSKFYERISAWLSATTADYVNNGGDLDRA